MRISASSSLLLGTRHRRFYEVLLLFVICKCSLTSSMHQTKKSSEISLLLFYIPMDIMHRIHILLCHSCPHYTLINLNWIKATFDLWVVILKTNSYCGLNLSHSFNISSIWMTNSILFPLCTLPLFDCVPLFSHSVTVLNNVLIKRCTMVPAETLTTFVQTLNLVLNIVKPNPNETKLKPSVLDEVSLRSLCWGLYGRLPKAFEVNSLWSIRNQMQDLFHCMVLFHLEILFNLGSGLVCLQQTVQ